MDGQAKMPVWTPADRLAALAAGAQAPPTFERNVERYARGLASAFSPNRAARTHAEELDELIATESDGAMLNFLVAQRSMRRRTGRWLSAS